MNIIVALPTARSSNSQSILRSLANRRVPRQCVVQRLHDSLHNQMLQLFPKHRLSTSTIPWSKVLYPKAEAVLPRLQRKQPNQSLELQRRRKKRTQMFTMRGRSLNSMIKKHHLYLKALHVAQKGRARQSVEWKGIT